MASKNTAHTLGLAWNREMEHVFRMRDSFRKYLLTSKPDFVVGFEYAIAVMSDQFWLVKAELESKE